MRQESSTTARGRVRAAGALGSFVFFALCLAAACAATPGAVSVPDMPAPAPNAAPAPQGETFSGTWTAAVKTEKADEHIQFSFSRRSDGNHSNFGQDYALTDFQGLTREQVRAAVEDSCLIEFLQSESSRSRTASGFKWPQKGRKCRFYWGNTAACGFVAKKCGFFSGWRRRRR